MDPGSGPVHQGSPNGALVPVLVSFISACLSLCSLPEHENQQLATGTLWLNSDGAQVLVRAPPDVLAVDVVRRVRDGDPLPDDLLRLLHAHLPRLLHHVRAPVHQGEANHRRAGVPAVPEPHRLQGCSTLLHSESSPNLKVQLLLQHLQYFV